jgi:hypothetical protein
MRITKLKLDALTVDSFDTGRIPSLSGTVHGHYEVIGEPASWPEGTCVDTCTTAFTGTVTCKWTCNDDTCGDSCRTGANDPRCQAYLE